MQPTDQNSHTIYQSIPRHVAVIMDGNGRWAEERNLPRVEGHKKGADSVRSIVTHCKKSGIKFLSLYTFSTENWKRPKVEVDGLMLMIASTLRAELNELHKNGVRIRVIGDIKKLPQNNQEAIASALEKTKNNKDLTLILALSYSGRDEILRMTKDISKQAMTGSLNPEELSEEDISAFLDTKDIPDPDLLIRTGGDKRISNFLLWQMAYSELYLTNKYWPDFNDEDLEEAISDFQERERKFGNIKYPKEKPQANHLSA